MRTPPLKFLTGIGTTVTSSGFETPLLFHPSWRYEGCDKGNGYVPGSGYVYVHAGSDSDNYHFGWLRSSAIMAYLFHVQ